MKRALASLVVSLLSLSVFAGSDHIILRNGQEHDVTLYQINDIRVVFSYDKKKNSERHEVPSTDVYMVYIEKQGNVYFNREGKRTTGEPKRVDPTKYDVIYLTEGVEIAAENVRITTEDVRFDVEKKDTQGKSGFKRLFGNPEVEEVRLEKERVFMIRYRNGMSDIITAIDSPLPEPAPDPQEETSSEPEFVVIFHSVVRGETLAKLAERYNVTAQDLIEWNDLPARQKPAAPLKPDMQLMIYQPKTK